jgi:hypothetical protein
MGAAAFRLVCTRPVCSTVSSVFPQTMALHTHSCVGSLEIDLWVFSALATVQGMSGGSCCEIAVFQVGVMSFLSGVLRDLNVQVIFVMLVKKVNASVQYMFPNARKDVTSSVA